jgi:CDP-diacylglycerol---serine O-phosphatidyltransferase
MKLGIPFARPRRLRPIRLPSRERLRKSVFLVPSMFTVGNMLCGFASVLAAVHGRFAAASWLIVLAGVLDGLDGRIARLTHSTSEFGKEYDSLADVVSFGVAPAMLAYQWRLVMLGRWGLALAFLFLVAGSVRLARFNVQAAVADKRFFTGLPIPMGAAAVTLLVLLNPSPLATHRENTLVGVFTLVVAFLMVSTVPYRSFKDFDLHRRFPGTVVFALALLVVVLVVYREHAMAAMVAAYLALGPAEAVTRVLRGGAPKAGAEATTTTGMDDDRHLS